jgi:hypothetical protein
MLDKIKALWSKWKVQVSVVGGVLIVATAYGTCSYQAPGAESTVEPTTEGVTETTEGTTGPTSTTPETTTTESTSATTPGTPTTADANSETTLESAVPVEVK